MAGGKEESINSVLFLKTDPKARYQGYSFYFREGFCWNNVLTTYLKCKKKEKTVQSTESMSFFSCSEETPEYFFVCLLNSRLVAQYVDNFINSTSHCTTGDAKLIPVIIPTKQELEKFKEIFYKAFKMKQSVAKGIATDSEIAQSLLETEMLNDRVIAQLYSIQS